MLDNKKKIIFLFILILIFSYVVGYLFGDDINNPNRYFSNDKAIRFNYDTGFYDKDITIKLSIDKNIPFGTKIYYTLDGTDPTIYSTLYSEPIKIKVSDEVKIHSVRAVLYLNGKYSNYFQEDYVVGKNVFDYYDLPVVNVTTDNYKQFLKGPDISYFKLRKTVNGHLSIFSTSGEVIYGDNLKITNYGNSSKWYDVKSFKLIANEGNNGKKKDIDLSYFNNIDVSSYSIISNYKNIRLSDGGQDLYASNIRNAIGKRIVNEAGYGAISTNNRVLVYLNNEFYGIFGLEAQPSSSFIGNRYGIDDNDKIIKSIEGSEKFALKDLGVLEYIEADLTKEENRKILEQYIDMDNYIDYYAYQIILNNIDWPLYNNVAWKYKGKFDKNNQYTDGRVRFLLFDLDLIYPDKEYSLLDDPMYDVFSTIMEEFGRGEGSSFINVMKSKYYRDKFISRVNELLNTSFKTENIVKVCDEEWAKVDNDYKNLLDEKTYNRQEKAYKNLRSFILNREKNLRKMMDKYFNLKGKYNFSVNTDNNSVVRFNGIDIYNNEEYKNEEYRGVDFSLEVIPNPGYKLEYIIINEKKYYDNKIIINDKLIKDNKIEVRVVTSYDKGTLIISEVNPNSYSDWLKITNISDKTINLNDYYLSNDKNNLSKYKLPVNKLNKGSSIFINGKDNVFIFNDYICNFKIKDESYLYLSDGKNIIDSIYVPLMDDNESYGHYMYTNVYKYFNNVNDVRKNC